MYNKLLHTEKLSTMIRTIPPKGPSIFITYDSDPDRLETLVKGKVYAKFEDVIDGSLGIHYVFANVNEDVESIANEFIDNAQ